MTAQTGGLLVPVCHRCNAGWNQDQEFLRLRIVMHAGSRTGAHYIKGRELSRLKGTAERKPQVHRYLEERSKTYAVKGEQLDGLTHGDFQRIDNVLRHWCAGIHYANRKVLADLPGSVTHKIERPGMPSCLTRKLYKTHKRGYRPLARGLVQHGFIRNADLSHRNVVPCPALRIKP